MNTPKSPSGPFPPQPPLVCDDPAGLQSLLELIFKQKGWDFREYNSTTLSRRLNKRLLARGVSDYEEYYRTLQENETEYEALRDALTVNQTEFFRNDRMYRVVGQKILDQFQARKESREPLAIWCAGCSTGQEPYSMAMLLLESGYSHPPGAPPPITATDIDVKALDYARAGVYNQKELESLPDKYRNGYMQPVGSAFSCRDEIRSLVRFVEHNMATEPVVSGIDLVVCRNVIIYFRPHLQMKVFQVFYKALKKDGFLFLGESEIPMQEARGLFSCLDFEARLYRKAR